MTTTIEIPSLPSDQLHQEQTAMSIVDKAKALVINSEQTLIIARDVVRQINERIKFAKDHHAPMKSAAQAAHKATVEAEKKVLTPLEEAKQIITDTANAYLKEQQRLEELERKRLADEAEKERRRKLDAAEKKVARILEKSGDDAKKIADLTEQLNHADTSEEEAYVLRNQIAIVQARIDGNQQKAAEIQQQAEAAVMSAPVAPAVPANKTVSGVVSRGKTVVEVRVPMDLIKAVAEGALPTGCIIFDQKTLVKLADAGMKLPGCVITKETNAHFR